MYWNEAPGLILDSVTLCLYSTLPAFQPENALLRRGAFVGTGSNTQGWREWVARPGEPGACEFTERRVRVSKRASESGAHFSLRDSSERRSAPPMSQSPESVRLCSARLPATGITHLECLSA